MPVVPFSPVPPQRQQPTEFTAAQEPWVLMAAAQMDAQGRLLKDNTQPPEDSVDAERS